MTEKIKQRILLIEDDINLSSVLKDYLEMLGYDVIHCEDGKQGQSTFIREDFDLCLLDIMMPVKDGFSVAEEIRKIDRHTPIIFLTAKSFKEDKIKAFQIGCDDYITKPFSTEELSLRIQAVIRRCSLIKEGLKHSTNQLYSIGEYRFDYENMNLAIANESIELTRKEADLLKLLCEHENQVLKRDDALRHVWGKDSYFIGRSMDVFISKLRKHLSQDPRISIKNIHGIGFKLEVLNLQD